MIMKLTKEQEALVREWVASGDGIAQVQDKLGALIEAGALTYMATRFLLDDLGLEIKDKLVPAAKVPDAMEDAESHSPLSDDLQASDGGGYAQVRVTVDPIQRPGLIAGGSAIFPDGEKAQWRLDESGRLSLIPATQGYRPTAENTAAFQKALQDVLG